MTGMQQTHKIASMYAGAMSLILWPASRPPVEVPCLRKKPSQKARTRLQKP